MYKALLVDDEYMILSGLKKIITWSDYEIEISGTASNGQEALVFIETQPVDLVITDVTMPVMSGIEFVRTAQQAGHSFHFIILSGYEEFEYVKESLVLGAENYLLKPIDKEELGRNLRCIIDKLSKEERKNDQEALFLTSVLKKWVEGTILIKELEHWLGNFQLPLKNEGYQVMIFFDYLEEKELILAYLKQSNQPFYYMEETKIVVIFKGTSQQASLLRRDIKSRGKLRDGQLAMGSYVTDPRDVAGSYDYADSFLELQRFYNVDQVGASTGGVQELTLRNDSFNHSFKAFQAALALGDNRKIEAEIDALFGAMYYGGLGPESVKPILFFVMTDIYRRFDQIGNADYQELLTKLNCQKDFGSLQRLVQELVANIQSNEVIKGVNTNVQRVLEIIINEYHLDLSLKDVGDRLHLNPMYLGQLFKKETKKSFSTYLNHYRIGKAEELLTHSDLNINEVAHQIGYTSAGYFYKNFKKIKGRSPKEYRLEKN